MKKRSLKSLQLNKRAISKFNLNQPYLVGGISGAKCDRSDDDGSLDPQSDDPFHYTSVIPGEGVPTYCESVDTLE